MSSLVSYVKAHPSYKERCLSFIIFEATKEFMMHETLYDMIYDMI
jgi:hypothetical protein